MFKSEAFAILPLSIQEAIILPMCTACRNHAEGRAEYVFHPLCLLVKIPALSLDNAD